MRFRLVPHEAAVLALLALFTVSESVQAQADRLPPDLKLVPANAPGFFTIRPADLWKSKDTEKLRQMLLKEEPKFAEEVVKSLGVELTDLERITAVMSEDPKTRGTFIMAATKAVDQALILKRMKPAGGASAEGGKDKPRVVSDPKLVEKKHAGKTYHQIVDEPAKRLDGGAVYFPSERIVVFGDGPGIRAVIDAETSTTGKGPLAEALPQAAGKAPIVAVATRPMLLQAAGEEPFRKLEGIEDLKKAKSGLITLICDRETRVTLQLGFDSKDEATAGSKALQGGVAAVKPMVAQFREQVGQGLKQDSKVPESQRWFLEESQKLLEAVGDALAGAKVEAKGEGVTLQMQAKISAGQALMFLMPRTVSSKSEPPPRTDRGDPVKPR